MNRELRTVQTKLEKHMTSTDLLRAFQFNQLTLDRNLAGITHDESMQIPHGTDNGINWILGHLIATRARMLTFLGAEPFWTAEQIELYQPESRARFLQQPAALEELQTALRQSLANLESGLAAFESRFGESTGRKPLFGDVETALHRTMYLACHEAYHAGQIGLIRRLLGKPGAL